MVYRKRRYLPYGRARSCFSWSTLAALRNPHSDICHFSLGILSGWLQILGGNGFSCVYKDLERRERYTSCIGWVLFRKVCDVFYLAYVLPNLSTLFLFLLLVYGLGLVTRSPYCFRSTGCVSMDWISVQYMVSQGQTSPDKILRP